MNLILGIVLSIVAVAALLGLIFYLWFWRKDVNSTKLVAPKGQGLQKSRFLDELYEGCRCKVDSSINYIMGDLVSKIPKGDLFIESFRYFNVDGNQFEEILFDNKEYMSQYDAYEKKLYLWQLFSESSVDDEPDRVPGIAKYDIMSLNVEPNVSCEFKDVTGLIESLSNGKPRLLRLYERTTNTKETEYLLGIIDDPNRMKLYVGYQLHVDQLIGK